MFESAAVKIFYQICFFFMPTPLWIPVFLYEAPPIVFRCLLIAYLVTVPLAAWVAKRLSFSDKDLFLIRSPRSAFLGCLLCWHVCLPVFLYNWRRVALGRVRPRSAAGKAKSNQGLEALWIVQILFVLAGMAMPGLVQSTARANEASAHAALRSYHAAQTVFRRRGRTPDAGAADGAYCDTFRGLYYNLDAGGRRLALISQAMADAFGLPPAVTPPLTANAGAAVPPSQSTPYHGYLFLDDPYVTRENLWDTEYGLFAVPVHPGKSGCSLYWIGRSGTVYRRQLPSGETTPPAIGPGDSPLHPDSAESWQLL